MAKSDISKPFERKIVSLQMDEFGGIFSRNLNQYRNVGQSDLTCPTWFPMSFECKRRTTEKYQSSWMKQAAAAAENQNKFPVVIYHIG